MEEQTCTHNCSTCSSNCSERQDLLYPQNPFSEIRHVIAVISGKGGVGKSSVTSALAVQMSRLGKKVAILDADITGPSIPKAFGIHEPALGDDNGIFPAETENGIKLMSINLLLENETDPVVWRGPVLVNVVRQFWSDVHWGDIDYMFVDMPPGTGDVPLTVFQSLPIDGIILVTNPQDLVNLIVEKSFRMAELMNVPVLGLVENFSGFVCPDCGKLHELFGKSKANGIAAAFGVDSVETVPIDPHIAALEDAGKIEQMTTDYLKSTAESLLSL